MAGILEEILTVSRYYWERIRIILDRKWSLYSAVSFVLKLLVNIK